MYRSNRLCKSLGGSSTKNPSKQPIPQSIPLYPVRGCDRAECVWSVDHSVQVPAACLCLWSWLRLLATGASDSVNPKAARLLLCAGLSDRSQAEAGAGNLNAAVQHQVIPVTTGTAIKLCAHTKQLVLVSIQASYVCLCFAGIA